MARQGYDLQLTRYDERGWRATFCNKRDETLADERDRYEWERTPWRVTQRVAWEALRTRRAREVSDEPD